MARDSRREAWTKQVGRRLEQELVRVGVKAVDVAKGLGVSKQRVSHWTRGNSEIQLFDLARLHPFGIDLEFVITGSMSSPKAVSKSAPPQRSMPVLTPKQILSFCQGKLDISELEGTEPAPVPCSDRAFAFDAFDTAMLPTFKPGSTRVAVDPDRYPTTGSAVLVALLATDDLLLRRAGWVPISPGLMKSSGAPPKPPATLIADNPSWPQTERSVRPDDKAVLAGTVFQIVQLDP